MAVQGEEGSRQAVGLPKAALARCPVGWAALAVFVWMSSNGAFPSVPTQSHSVVLTLQAHRTRSDF